jgi:membrane dipeptidase
LKNPPKLIIDAHEDLAFNALSLKRNFLLPISEIRSRDLPSSSKHGIPTISLEELKRGNVRIVFATLWAAPCIEGEDYSPCYSTAEQAHEQALQQLEFYKKLVAEKHANLITNKRELEAVVKSKEMLGLVLLMEGADPILAPDETQEWFRKGVRIVGPAWHQTRYAGGTKAPGPLTDLGRKLIAEMERAGMILDTSHFAEQSFFEALKLFKGSVIASHSNCRIYTPTDRHLSDEMIRELVRRGGVIGTVLRNQFLESDWVKHGKVKSDVTLESVVKHMKHVCEIAGDSLHSGIGSDLDGGFGAEGIPLELDTVADLEKIGQALSEAGLSDTNVGNIMAGNWLRVLRRALPE